MKRLIQNWREYIPTTVVEYLVIFAILGMALSFLLPPSRHRDLHVTTQQTETQRTEIVDVR